MIVDMSAKAITERLRVGVAADGAVLGVGGRRGGSRSSLRSCPRPRV